jgi:beta-glucanase (GH16 family)
MKRVFLLFSAAMGVAAALQAATPAIIWSDEFNQPIAAAPDPSKWSYDLGGGGWGNGELEVYTDARENSAVVADAAASDGRALALTAVRSSTGSYTSARLKTSGKFAATYGRIEARLKLTRGRGVWPAFWMLGDTISTVGWPACGEIDIMEQLGHEPGKIYGTIHGPGYSGANGLGSMTTLPDGTPLSDAYHVYAVDWTPEKIEWSLDGVAFYSRTPAQIPAGTRWVFNTPFFLILNVAVGGAWPGNPDSSTTFPQMMLIDYVRVYGLPPTAPATVAGYVAAGQARLTWTPPDDTRGGALTGYRVERATNRAFTQNVAVRDLGAATSFADATVQTGVNYFYRVSAMTAGGVSDPSPPLQLQAPATTGVTGNARLINLASRAYVGTGGNLSIAGFVISGDASKRFLIRGVGPTLAGFGLAGALAEPVLSLFDAQARLLAVNRGWSDNANSADIASAAVAVGAFALSAGSKDAALLVTLTPGAYTAQVAGFGGGTGTALVEVYEVP